MAARPKPMSIAIVGLLVVFVGLAVLHAVVYFVQDRLIFLPQPLDDAMRAAVHRAVPDAQEIELRTADRNTLHGWYLPNGAPPRNAPALVYFGGNAEEVSRLALEAGELRGVSLILMNYRGYGRSTGRPSEQALFADALTIYDHVAKMPGVDARRIIVMGRSLGSGVATYLASRRRVSAVVLVTPYDSMAAVGHTHYPFLLVGPLLKHPFDSVHRAPGIDSPMLAIIAGADTIIPPSHGQALVKAWRGPASSAFFPAAGHNDIRLQPAYWPAIRDFIRIMGTPLAA
ncbi:MAG TPA: alpha/beta hydrolase [Gemmatimonadaceae bacterium]|nr:alpha/beta hydrolase [Gemmatimonadaceae bacterium]